MTQTTLVLDTFSISRKRCLVADRFFCLPTAELHEIPNARFCTVCDRLNIFHRADVDGRVKHAFQLTMWQPRWHLCAPWAGPRSFHSKHISELGLADVCYGGNGHFATCCSCIGLKGGFSCSSSPNLCQFWAISSIRCSFRFFFGKRLTGMTGWAQTFSISWIQWVRLAIQWERLLSLRQQERRRSPGMNEIQQKWSTENLILERGWRGLAPIKCSL